MTQFFYYTHPILSNINFASKDSSLQEIYDFISKYFEPKLPRSSSATDQETDASADDPAEPQGANGIGGDDEGRDELDEEAPPCLEDAYPMNPQDVGETGATNDDDEKLCWSLGGELRNEPSPNTDFEKFSEPKDSPAFVLPPPGSPANPEVLQSVQKRIQELE